MTEQEQKDLDALKAEVQKKELSCYYYMKSILSYDETARLHAGFRTSGRVWTIAEALEHAIRDNEKVIAKLHKDYDVQRRATTWLSYIKKYPDDK